MSEKENQALECMRQKQWFQASQIFDQILGPNFNFKVPREKVLSWLMSRSECSLELNLHDSVAQDCRKLIKILGDTDVSNLGARARRRLVHSLFQMKMYNDAEQACAEWMNSNFGPHNNAEIKKTLERLRTVLQIANGQKNNQRISQQKLDEEMLILDSKLESWAISSQASDKSRKMATASTQKAVTGINMPENHLNRKRNQSDTKKSTSDPVGNVNNFQKQIEQVGKQSEATACSYCSLTFSDRAGLRAHCATHQHQTVIMSDEGRDWKWRPPPRGFTSDTYVLCESWEASGSSTGTEGTCRYGAQCVEAHGPEELAEWKERFEYRKMKMQRACEKELYGKSYTEQLLEKWIQATSPEKIMREKLDGVEEICNSDLITTVSSKVSKREWTFVLKTKRLLKAVALLQDAHRNHFILKQVFPGEPKPNKKGHKVVEADLTSDQEWTASNTEKSLDAPDQGPTLEHRIKVIFSTDIYGTFRQSVVFDLGSEPVLVKHLCVDVVPVTDADKIKEIRKEMVLSSSERWDTCNADVVPFSSPVYPGLATPHGSETCERDRDLLNAYPAPRANNLCLTQATVTERHLTRNNYRTRMHELLSVEEMARYEQVARYNLTCRLRVAASYLLAPSGMATSTAKYAHSGELFALLTLGKDVSEDTSAGRLILNNCTTVLLAASPAPGGGPRRVYESLIEDKGKNMIYLRLSAITVRELAMRGDTDFSADVQFQLNRLTYCEWHYAIDKIADYRLIFPDTVLEPNIPWTPHRQWSESLDSRLNSKQKEAVLAITTPVGMPIPPILIIGPFGTGKTYTLAQAIKQLLLQPESKILICTHSNSAADLYIKDYLHPWLEGGMTEARPLRIYYHKRWVTTVDQVVQKYCLIELNGGVRNFRLPCLEDILKHRIVVVTLSISMYLSTLGLPKGYFTHILLDEAAQAMESEALMPLALATPTSRIVLAGDHMQLSPELFSQFAKERNLHISLLERLYDRYPANFPCKILLCENYRAHEAIIGFTSELFYEQKLIASGKQPRHDKFYPLTFFTTRGEDVQDQNSTAFYNNSEVYEVVERICELRRKWPPAWGKPDEQSIGIMTPYADQVFRIRSELRKRRMGGISVERVLNVQGKQFRAVFLSTVRTRRTCQAAAELDYGFLSNRKLLNTAITRAQSLVAVVGDPVALCSIGRCRKVWERFIRICNENESLFGITWTLLRSQLDGVELKKTYTLNPLAPEFVPRALQPEAYIKLQQASVRHAVPALPGLGPLAAAPITQTGAINIRQPGPGQMPPALGLPEPPMASFPLFHFLGGAGQPQPHGGSVFPMARAPPSQPPAPAPYPHPAQPNPSVNPWTVNSFALASPNGRSTPTWPLKQTQKKPSDTSPGANGPLRVLHSSAPPTRSIAAPQHLMAPPAIPSKQNFLPLLSQQRLSPEASPVPTGFAVENFNELMSPAFLRNAPISMPPERLSYPPASVKYQEPERPAPSQDKDHIQFLQNVHFPERGPTSGRVHPVLLPHATHREIPSEGHETHLQWYRHLLDTQGVECASHYMDMILQQRTMAPPRPQKPAPPIQEQFPHVDNYSRMAEDVFSEKGVRPGRHFVNYGTPNGHAPPTLSNDVERPWPMTDMKPNVVGHYVNSKPFVREFDAPAVFSGAMYHPNAGQRDERTVLQRGFSQQDPGLDLPWQTNKPVTQSVPLYRRQAGRGGSRGEAPIPQGLLDTLDKQNTSAGAFAGYARAFSLQQTEPSHLGQHGPTSSGDRGMPNGVLGPECRIPPPSRQHPHHMHQQHAEADYSRPLNGAPLEGMDGDGATYASVLRQTTPKPDEDKGDPFVGLRDFGHKPQPYGLYHYFD